MRRLILAIFVVAFIALASLDASSPSPKTTVVNPAALVLPAPPPCRLFSAEHVARYAWRMFVGTKPVISAERRHLAWEEGCLRQPSGVVWVRQYVHRLVVAHQARINALPAWQTAYSVSNYDDSGTHCCGTYAYYGVAVCGSGGGPCVPMGTRIEFLYNGRTVTAIADDHGPYVGGRWFDLNENTAAALGAPGVADIQYRIL